MIQILFRDSRLTERRLVLFIRLVHPSTIEQELQMYWSFWRRSIGRKVIVDIVVVLTRDFLVIVMIIMVRRHVTRSRTIGVFFGEVCYLLLKTTNALFGRQLGRVLSAPVELRHAFAAASLAARTDSIVRRVPDTADLAMSTCIQRISDER